MGIFDIFSRKKRAPKLDAVFVSEIGLKRPSNQDNVLVMLNHGVFAVADGIGGAQGGEIASAIACAELRSMIRVGGESFVERVKAAKLAVQSANSAILAEAKSRGYEMMGTTVAIIVIDPKDSKSGAAVHVGDSRAYRLRGGMAERITRDHREFGGNSLTRAVGAMPRVSCEVTKFEIRRGDRFLVCTDGVHSAIEDKRIATLACGGTLESAAERLSGGIVRAGAPDNYSFVLVDI